ncbi:MAG TPA: type IV pilus assembly protein PilM [Candidatus Paceibacterota bacterium]
MGLFSFDVIPKTYVGIDVGSSALRVVEIAGWGDRRTLKNYGELRIRTLYDKPFRSFEKNALLLSTHDIARAIRGIIEETGIKEKNAIFSISDYSSFFTDFELPPMDEKELPDAVRFEARRHVPLPLSEVVLDWQLVEKRKKKQDPFRVLLVAVPKEVIHHYEEIARLAKLKLVVIEPEVFGGIRVHLKEEKYPAVLMDIGSHTTTVSIVYKGLLRMSHSIDTGGNSFTERVARAFSLNYDEAEEKKQAEGMNIVSGNVRILVPVADAMLLETKKLLENFKRQEPSEVRKIVLSGGAASLKGLDAYLERQTRLKTEIIQPFGNILYPPILESKFTKEGPLYAVAVGMALRGFEQ